MLYDHDQCFIPKTNSLGEKIKKSLRIFHFPKLNIQNELIVWEACAKHAKVL
jgi:hypothetical protein